MKAKLARALAERRFVRLHTYDPSGANYDGYIVHLGRDFVAMCHAPNFQIDGWQVLSRRFVRGVRDGRLEATANEVLRMHGVEEREASGLVAEVRDAEGRDRRTGPA